MKRVGVALGAAGVVVLLLVGGWIGGELHYRNCLSSVDLRYPVAYQQANVSQAGQYREELGISPAHAGFVFDRAVKRDAAISNCSRWP